MNLIIPSSLRTTGGQQELSIGRGYRKRRHWALAYQYLFHSIQAVLRFHAPCHWLDGLARRPTTNFQRSCVNTGHFKVNLSYMS